MAITIGTIKRLLYIWNIHRIFRKNENREVAMLLYDHLGVGIYRVADSYGGRPFYILVIYKRDEEVGALCTYTELLADDAADEAFRNLGWDRLWRSQDYWDCDLGIPQFSSLKELKMKLELRGLENKRK